MRLKNRKEYETQVLTVSAINRKQISSRSYRDREPLQESDQTAWKRHECEHTYRAEFSLANCDFSVWNGVPNVMTEQVGGERR